MLKRKVLGSVLSVIMLMASFFSNFNQANAAEGIDFSIPGTKSLTHCVTVSDLDCIEAFGLVDDSGKYFDAKFLSIDNNPSFLSSEGDVKYNNSTNWIVDSQRISFLTTLDSPTTKGCNGVCAALRVNFRSNEIKSNKVRIVIRTSWLKPMNIQLKALDADYKYESIAGGHKWTFEGRAIKHSTYIFSNLEELNQKKLAGAKADLDESMLYFYVHHAGRNIQESYWDPVCSDQGFSVQSHNTNETGDPTWDSQANSLKFNIFAPHLRADGTVNEGYFKYWTTQKFMDCKYPANTLTKASKLVLEVFNEDGTRNVATTSVTNVNGNLYFYATGFHFSSPIIQVRPAPDSKIITGQENSTISPISPSTVKPLNSPSPTAKPNFGNSVPHNQSSKSTLAILKCQKGKTIITYASKTGLCPKGYKKK